MALVGGFLTVNTFRTRPVVTHDTRLQSGGRVRLIVVAPTSQSARLNAVVGAAIESLRAAAQRQGDMFETVGVSDNWLVASGLRDLEALGSFDEVIVGRNWLNHGVERYITNLGGRAVVPQLVLVHQVIGTDSIPFTYGPVTQLYRAAGMLEIIAWSEQGFPFDVSSTRLDRSLQAESVLP
ncbi:MAG: hypothetical protein ABI542_11630 [Gemmatimonadota bacterium]